MSNPRVSIPLRPQRLPPRIPQAAHRHATPSGPWPFVDATVQQYEQVSREEQAKLDALHEEALACASDPWRQYPQSLYPNWTYTQQKASGLLRLIVPQEPSRGRCTIHHVEVANDGSFSESDAWTVDDGNELAFWQTLAVEDEDATKEEQRVKMFFVDSMSGPVMQILGTRYNIEPFFFTSSINFIPARYRESLVKDQSDHITITLTFLRSVSNPLTRQSSINTITTPSDRTPTPLDARSQRRHRNVIDPQAPLPISSSGQVLSLDLISLHMIRNPAGSTAISYHPDPLWYTTTARHLHSRVSTAGRSVYWQKIFRESADPTLVLVVMMWYPLYAWDEALEVLYDHIYWLESRVLATNDIHITRQLHVIRGSLLHYQTLLDEFRKSIDFILATPNPFMLFDEEHARHLSTEEFIKRKSSRECLEQECATLLGEIARLDQSIKTHNSRLANVVDLTFNSVNFEDSQYMRSLSEASLHDSKIVKQISYLTMVFLPTSFVCSFFGMNIDAVIGSEGSAPFWAWWASVIPLTIVTIWLVIAIHGAGEDSDPVWLRMIWPFRHGKRLLWRFWAWLHDLFDVDVTVRQRTRKGHRRVESPSQLESLML